MQSVQYTNTEDSAHGVHWNTGLESERELKPERVREGEKEQKREIEDEGYFIGIHTNTKGFDL